jgi:hypothetical protein
VDAYRLLPSAAAPAVAHALIRSECAAAIALALAALGISSEVPHAAVAMRLGGAAATVLLALYTSAIAANLARGRRDLDCGCHGPASRTPISWGLVVRNLAAIGAGLLCLATAAPRELVWLDAVTLVAAVLAAALLWSAAETALANEAPSALLRRTT